MRPPTPLGTVATRDRRFVLTPKGFRRLSRVPPGRFQPWVHWFRRLPLRPRRRKPPPIPHIPKHPSQRTPRDLGGRIHRAQLLPERRSPTHQPVVTLEVPPLEGGIVGPPRRSRRDRRPRPPSEKFGQVDERPGAPVRQQLLPPPEQPLQRLLLHLPRIAETEDAPPRIGVLGTFPPDQIGVVRLLHPAPQAEVDRPAEVMQTDRTPRPVD